MRVVRIAVGGLVLVALILSVVAYAFVGRDGLSADRRPGRIEEAVARRLVRLSLPVWRRNMANPLLEKDAWRGAVDHYAEHCAVCHGANGRGAATIGARMYPPVPDLASDAIQQFSDGALFSIIQNGVSWTGMPAFRSTDSDEDTWRLVSFVRHLPTLTAADLERSHGAVSTSHDQVTTILMDGTQFRPSEVEVHAGEAVVWVNQDPFPHNVASDAGQFHSGELSPGASWRFSPAARGTFRYVCTLHPGMTGTIHVN
jgi:plastocyanin